jgi:hypothetical protein
MALQHCTVLKKKTVCIVILREICCVRNRSVLRGRHAVSRILPHTWCSIVRLGEHVVSRILLFSLQELSQG